MLCAPLSWNNKTKGLEGDICKKRKIVEMQNQQINVERKTQNLEDDFDALPTFEEAKIGLKPRVEVLKRELPKASLRLGEIREYMQQIVNRIKEKQFSDAARLATYMSSIYVLKSSIDDTIMVVSDERYDDLDEQELAWISIAIIGSMDLKESMIELVDLFKSDNFTNEINCEVLNDVANQIYEITKTIPQIDIPLDDRDDRYSFRR
jgi:hypothetical protein